MKKLLTIAMITLATMVAKADLYLYWTVNVGEFTGASYAVLETAGGTTITSMVPGAGTYGKSPMNEGYFIDSVAYYVALYDSAIKKIAISESSYSYNDIIAHTYTATSGDITAKPSDVTALSVSGFASTIPEPTSGLMLLLGLAGLALKRKIA